MAENEEPMKEHGISFYDASLLVMQECVPVIGKNNTAILHMLVMTRHIAPPSEKGILFLTRTIERLKGKVSDRLVEFLTQYFRL